MRSPAQVFSEVNMDSPGEVMDAIQELAIIRDRTASDVTWEVAHTLLHELRANVIRNWSFPVAPRSCRRVDVSEVSS